MLISIQNSAWVVTVSLSISRVPILAFARSTIPVSFASVLDCVCNWPQAELLEDIQLADQERAQHLQDRELKLNPHVSGKGWAPSNLMLAHAHASRFLLHPLSLALVPSVSFHVSSVSGLPPLSLSIAIYRPKGVCGNRTCCAR